MQGDGEAAQFCFLDVAAVFIRIGGGAEQTLDAELNFGSGGFGGGSGHGDEALGELVGTQGEVFRQIVKNLYAVVSGGLAPCAGGVGGFYGIADVFTVAVADLPDLLIIRV